MSARSRPSLSRNSESLMFSQTLVCSSTFRLPRPSQRMLCHVIRKVIQSESSVQTDLVCSGTWAIDEKWASQTVGDWLAGAEHDSARVLPPTSLLRFSSPPKSFTSNRFAPSTKLSSTMLLLWRNSLYTIAHCTDVAVGRRANSATSPHLHARG